jgi:hypothetical protein
MMTDDEAKRRVEGWRRQFDAVASGHGHLREWEREEADAMVRACETVMTLRAERDEARRLLAAAARGDLPRCNECERTATRRWADADGGACDVCAVQASADDAAALEDLPHAVALRAAMEAAK